MEMKTVMSPSIPWFVFDLDLILPYYWVIFPPSNYVSVNF